MTRVEQPLTAQTGDLNFQIVQIVKSDEFSRIKLLAAPLRALAITVQPCQAAFNAIQW
jgi:hypothetical protein